MAELTTLIMTVDEDVSIREAMATINHGGYQIAVVLDTDGRVVGLIGDGDIRRAILRGIDIDGPAGPIINRHPVCSHAGDDGATQLRLMEEHLVNAIPVVDHEGRFLSVTSIHDIVGRAATFRDAVIFAGGEGQRLRPLTENLPKPMVEVGGRPLIEHAVERLARTGVGRVHVAVNYMAEVIRGHLRDGADLGAAVSYIEETTRLGTAGALALIEDEPDGPILVMNGDILTDFDASSLFHFHRTSNAALTVGVVKYRLQIPFGVVEMEDGLVTGIDEKPMHQVHINAGVYAVEPSLLRLVPRGRPYNMTDLIADTLKESGTIAPFLIHEHWIDVGTPGDLERAQVLAATLSRQDSTGPG
jgi:dTDP-glucose pyrophosphorylase